MCKYVTSVTGWVTYTINCASKYIYIHTHIQAIVGACHFLILLSVMLFIFLTPL